MRTRPPFDNTPRVRRSLATRFLFLLVLVCSSAECAELELNADVRGLIAAAGLKNAAVGVSVINVDSGSVLCSIGDDELMTPASNVKLITTGCALLLLGEKFEFTTSVYAAGRIGRNGTLAGDLVVVAGGDPAISGREHEGKTTAVFDAWAAEIARSVKVVRGNLVIDDTIFDRQYVHPAWPANQLVRWYCAPVSAFALNDNCVDVKVLPGARPGQPARVILDPPTGYFKIRNKCQTVASGKAAAYIHRLPGEDILVISGKLTPKSAGAASPVTVANPAAYAASVLWERLAEAGVRVQGEIMLAGQPVDTGSAKLLASTTHSLVSAVQTANKRSQNFYAEMILKTMGHTVADRASFADGVRAVAKHLDAAGIKEGSYVMDDGSGLSKRNAFSARQLAGFLRHMALSNPSKPFLDSLAVSGLDGTLKRRMSKPPYAGNVLAKTGHVRGVSSLSGYVRSGDELLAFSILVNGEGLKQAAADRLQDSICRFLVDAQR